MLLPVVREEGKHLCSGRRTLCGHDWLAGGMGSGMGHLKSLLFLLSLTLLTLRQKGLEEGLEDGGGWGMGDRIKDRRIRQDRGTGQFCLCAGEEENVFLLPSYISLNTLCPITYGLPLCTQHLPSLW